MFIITGGILLLLLIIAANYKPPNKSLLKPNETSLSGVRALTAQCALSETSPFKEKVFGLSVTPPYSPEYYALLSDLDVPWVRADFHWSRIERIDGTYDWRETDEFMAEMYKRKINIAGIINYIPWHFKTWKETQGQLAKFSLAIAERYKRDGVLAKEMGWKEYGISHWEIFNEPNLPGYGWLSPESDPRGYIAEYAALLAIANRGIHTKDPGAIIVLAGLSPDGMPYDEFLKEFYALETKNCFDVLAFHPYGRSDRFAKMADELRGLMAKAGDSSKGVWFNEFGTTEEKDRETYIRQMFEGQKYVEGFFWFGLRDLKPFTENFGLVKYDFSKKPAYETFRELMKMQNTSI